MTIIGIAGGTGSGKTSFVEAITKDIPDIAILSLDNYYKDFGHVPIAERLYVNYDHPDAFDWNLLYRHIKSLKRGKPIEQPEFSFLTCTCKKHSKNIFYPPKLLIVEGILALYDASVRNTMEIKIFLDIDSGIRLLRIIARDQKERNHNEEFTIKKYISVLEPMHLQFVLPTKHFADIVIQSQKHKKILEYTFKQVVISCLNRE